MTWNKLQQLIHKTRLLRKLRDKPTHTPFDTPPKEKTNLPPLAVILAALESK